MYTEEIEQWDFVSENRKDCIKESLKAVLVAEDRKLNKQFFQCLRYFSLVQLSQEEIAKVSFFVRRQMLSDLLEAASEVEIEDQDENLKKLGSLSRRLEAPLEGRSVSNAKIFKLKDEILELASCVCAEVESVDLEEYEKVFGEKYEPTLSELLAVEDDVIPADW